MPHDVFPDNASTTRSSGKYVTSNYLEGGSTDGMAQKHSFTETAVDRYSQYYFLSQLMDAGVNTLRSPHSNVRLPIDGALLDVLNFFSRPASISEYLSENGGDASRHAFVQTLIADRFLFSEDVDQDRCFNLLNVEIDTNTVCNQACTFCPVSIAPRKKENIAEDLFDDILEQAAALQRNPADRISVYLAAYNEISLDKRYPTFARKIKEKGFDHTVFSNGSHLKPRLVDQLLDVGISKFVLNVPALDADEYHKLRGTRDITKIIANVDYLAGTSADVTIVVHGVAGFSHYRNFTQMKARFRDTPIHVVLGQTMDRVGNVHDEFQSTTYRESLHGCMNDGSRLINWIHVNAKGQCYICPMDYYFEHLVGDLRQNSIQEVLSGDSARQLRRYLHGIEDAPEDFICRRCLACIPASWKDVPAQDATPLGAYKSRVRSQFKHKYAALRIFVPLYVKSFVHNATQR